MSSAELEFNTNEDALQTEKLRSIQRKPSAKISSSAANVFIYPSQSCNQTRSNGEWGDRADMAARAFIDFRGQIQFYSGYFDMFRMTGRDFNSLNRICGTNGSDAVHISPNDSDYSSHRSREWLQAFYTKDGESVAALASVDWNGFWYSSDPICKNLNSSPPGNIRCWWNKLTAFRSNDGGLRFNTSSGVFRNTSLALPPGVPGTKPDQGNRYGFFHLTNILKDPKTGHYFFFTSVTGSKLNNVNNQKDGLCLMRAWSSSDLANPNSWHSWSGGSNITHPRNQEACLPIRMPPKLGGARFLGYSNYFKKYILFSGGSLDGGFYFALSDRLDQWPNESYLIPFMSGKTLYYSTLIDHNYASLVDSMDEAQSVKNERRNFDIVGQNPHIYYVEKTQNEFPVLKRVGIRFSK